MQEPNITDEVIAAHGFTPDEYQEVLRILNRDPNFTELGIFSAMWNEHCSYKSSKKWLRTLPTDGPQVICGPGDIAQAHQPNEFISVDQFKKGEAFIEKLVAELAA